MSTPVQPRDRSVMDGDGEGRTYLLVVGQEDILVDRGEPSSPSHLTSDHMQPMTALAQQLSKPFPTDWTVKRAMAAYLDENGFAKDEYDKPVVDVTFWSLTFPVPNPPSRQIAVRMHDLHHVVTGYGTDPCGEAEVSAWELRRGIRCFSWFVQCIILGGVIMGLLCYPRRTLAAWRAGRSDTAVGLQVANMARYDELLEMDILHLRQLYGVPSEGLAGGRALHYAAPSRSQGQVQRASASA